LSKDLWWSEVYRGSGYDEHEQAPVPVQMRMAVHAAESWQPIRAAWGDTLIIVAGGGLRSPEMNERVGGSPTSRHVAGDATDVKLPAIRKNREYLDLYDLIDRQQRDGAILRGGLALYWSSEKKAIRFLHFDSRGEIARWNAGHLEKARSYYV